MHCHMESHNANGMALVIQEGNVSDMNRLPTGFKTCGNFDWSEEEFQSLRKEPSGRCHENVNFSSFDLYFGICLWRYIVCVRVRVRVCR